MFNSSSHSSHKPLMAHRPGERVRIARIEGGRMMQRRLQAMGLQIGTEVSVMHHPGHGMVVACHQTRLALGRGIAERLFVEHIATSSDGASDQQGMGATA
ncbi:ferrous iron transport protein A [Gammaproteobacteria bacterium]